MPINDVNPEPPYAGPPAIAIGNNGLGISPLFDRLLFNVSEDYGYTHRSERDEDDRQSHAKAGVTYLHGLEDDRDRVAALRPLHHRVGFQQRAVDDVGDR